MKPAFIIIDVQKDFFRNGRLKEHRTDLTKHINELTSFARSHNFPVIWVRQEFKADLSDVPLVMKRTQTPITIEHTKGSRLLEELKQEPTDHEIIKKRYSALFNTNLDELLKNLGVDRLIIGGINTHACVRTTAIDAYQRDYDVIIATDCTDSYDEEHHNISLKYLTHAISTAKNNEEIFAMLT